MRKPLTKEGRDALFLYKKQRLKQTEKGNCNSLFCLNNFSFWVHGVVFFSRCSQIKLGIVSFSCSCAAF
ncbi:hypothetical protein CWM57_14465 [Klebsiella sp. G-Nf4]|nr:hypothetical protein CWM64_15785 [Klebsiella sp. I-Nf8]PJX28839.1 hypothetical protein CWM53_28195 [Klebsiella sp. A-Nf5]PJX36334.1 hypothetical protein CWM59_18190 [Klebsiella sp. B-Nf7]PJX46775.1 hypothetical protein CWM60_19835 [Klebsiella sp. C1-16S-Nf17]PJX69517.1 hypothetical protein CWM57_14465 [Klebsiella sp. G-Nf4]PJX75881.1 hypothetical protein CWM55_07700 [Klebsiella sp. G2-16S-Nf13]PKJ74870.1 hypothetical protein CWM65_15965 [Klebsiella sp. J-Nf11]